MKEESRASWGALSQKNLLRPFKHIVAQDMKRFKTRNFDFENEHSDNDFGPQHLVHSLVTSALDAKVDHRVGQAAAHVELQGEVVDTLRVLWKDQV